MASVGDSAGSMASRLTGQQRTIVFLMLGILVIEGIDLSFLPVAAPIIIDEWHVTTSSFGVALSAALIGMGTGSIAGGYLGDRFGRKAVVLVSLILFGLSTGLHAAVNDVAQLAILRLAGGFGFGAATPAAIALCAEWSPPDRRARLGSMMSVGLPLGGLLATYLAILMLPALGWRGSFIVLGALTLLWGVLIWLLVPESAHILRQRGMSVEAEMLELRVHGRLVEPEPQTPRAKATSWLGGAEMARFNVGIWIAFAASSYVTYTLANWLPVLLTGLGLSFREAALGLMCVTISALPGTLSAGWLTSRFGSRLTGYAVVSLALSLSLAFGLAALNVSQGGEPISRWTVFGICAGLGLTQGTIAGVLYGLITVHYPVAIRATGIGVALTIAKVGGVIAIVAGGFLLAGPVAPQAMVIAMFALMLALLAGGLRFIDRHIPPLHTVKI